MICLRLFDLAGVIVAPREGSKTVWRHPERGGLILDWEKHGRDMFRLAEWRKK